MALGGQILLLRLIRPSHQRVMGTRSRGSVFATHACTISTIFTQYIPIACSNRSLSCGFAVQSLQYIILTARVPSPTSSTGRRSSRGCATSARGRARGQRWWVLAG
jgi:hypothetical protein